MQTKSCHDFFHICFGFFWTFKLREESWLGSEIVQGWRHFLAFDQPSSNSGHLTWFAEHHKEWPLSAGPGVHHEHCQVWWTKASKQKKKRKALALGSMLQQKGDEPKKHGFKSQFHLISAKFIVPFCKRRSRYCLETILHKIECVLYLLWLQWVFCSFLISVTQSLDSTSHADANYPQRLELPEPPLWCVEASVYPVMLEWLESYWG